MKRFLSQVSFFTLLVLSYFCLNFGINFFIYKNQKIIIKNRLLVAGDSHSKRGINPQILGDAVNVSQLGEPYYITFWKLKKIFRDNKNTIDTLILGFAPHNISEFNDYKLSHERWSGKMFKRAYPIHNLNELEGIDIDYLKFYKVLWKEVGFYPKRNHINYKGSYVNTNEVHDLNFEKALSRHFYKDGKPLSSSFVCINYLVSIVNLSNQYKVETVLVSSPVHSSYYKGIPKNIIDKYLELVNKYESKGLRVVNKTHEVYSDSLYFDVDHLNDLGATKFTNELKKELKQESNFTKI